MLTPLLLAFTLTSPDVKDGARIPSAFVWNKNGCTGKNRTPRLRWSDPPRGTRSFALTVRDYDASKRGGWMHWRVIGIIGSARTLAPALASGAALEETNDFGTQGWGGPCPPPGPAHHYTFTLDALDLRGRIIGTARMTPVYQR